MHSHKCAFLAADMPKQSLHHSIIIILHKTMMGLKGVSQVVIHPILISRSGGLKGRYPSGWSNHCSSIQVLLSHPLLIELVQLNLWWRLGSRWPLPPPLVSCDSTESAVTSRSRHQSVLWWCLQEAGDLYLIQLLIARLPPAKRCSCDAARQVSITLMNN